MFSILNTYSYTFDIWEQILFVGCRLSLVNLHSHCTTDILNILVVHLPCIHIPSNNNQACISLFQFQRELIKNAHRTKKKLVQKIASIQFLHLSSIQSTASFFLIRKKKIYIGRYLHIIQDSIQRYTIGRIEGIRILHHPKIIYSKRKKQIKMNLLHCENQNFFFPFFCTYYVDFVLEPKHDVNGGDENAKSIFIYYIVVDWGYIVCVTSKNMYECTVSCKQMFNIKNIVCPLELLESVPIHISEYKSFMTLKEQKKIKILIYFYIFTITIMFC